MSVVNLIANLVRPDYPMLYLVESQDMAEAVAKGAIINSTVGKLSRKYDESLHAVDPKLDNPKSEDARHLRKVLEKNRFLGGLITVLLGHLVPLAVIGGLTHFHKGGSTHSQRVWIMIWIVLRAICGSILDAVSLDVATEGESNDNSVVFLTVFYALFFAAPAIGGFVVVAQEIRNYGVCNSI